MKTWRSAGRLRRATTLPWLVVAVATVLLVAAATLAWQAQDLRQDPALQNRAQLDETVQDSAIAAVSQGLTQVLSYDYKSPDATRGFADQVLTGQARKQYDTLFASLQERGPGQ